MCKCTTHSIHFNLSLFFLSILYLTALILFTHESFIAHTSMASCGALGTKRQNGVVFVMLSWRCSGYTLGLKRLVEILI